MHERVHELLEVRTNVGGRPRRPARDGRVEPRAGGAAALFEATSVRRARQTHPTAVRASRSTGRSSSRRRSPARRSRRVPSSTTSASRAPRSWSSRTPAPSSRGSAASSTASPRSAGATRRSRRSGSCRRSDGHRRAAAARARRGDARGVPARGGQPRARARARARRARPPGRGGTSASGSSSCSPSRPARRARGSSRCAAAASPPEVPLEHPYELGQEFFRWEFATAVAGSLLGINPFDQPDVQAAKDKTNEVLARGARFRSSPRATSTRCSRSARGRLRRDPGVRRPGAKASSSRSSSGARRPAVSVGLGPRYLHSTGSSTRAGRTPASSCRSSTTSARSCRSPAATSASAPDRRAGGGRLRGAEERGRGSCGCRCEARDGRPRPHGLRDDRAAAAATGTR